MDLYNMLAKSWGLQRKEAKMRFLLLIEEAGGVPARFDWAEEPYRCLAFMQPLVLNHMPEDVRFELLGHYRIHLGVN
jgi:hypothetical protein